MAFRYRVFRLLFSILVSARLSCSLLLRTGGRYSSTDEAVVSVAAANVSTVLGSQWPLNTSHAGMLEARPPRIFFLFMAIDKISNLGVWKKFFAQATPSQYRAFLHCKLPGCNEQVANSVIKVVQTVPSYYCTDLVSPMQQLVHFALSDDPHSVNSADKFVFISDSTLPGKPFSHIYSTLTVRAGSDFCAFPSNEWADVQGPSGLEMAVKYHQWIVLERAHAQKAWELWASGTDHNFMSRFQMNMHSYNSWSNNTYGDHRNFGCLDEFWHMIALFGTIKHVDANSDAAVSFSHFTGAPLRVSRTAGWQGQCDTFVMWSKYLNTAGNNPFKRFHSTLDAVSIPHGGNDQRPGWWDTISPAGISAIRNSEFLFIRKFIDNPQIAGGGNFETEYTSIVLL
mmetsp:Transcript_56109/g.88960  ORF Transcript_56109/g.88960 Transcript_56109/m.88960 type:complete len:397 (+) Transcript_56109:79-1269(+)